MIDVKLVKKWIAALRSGKYKQGKGYLKERRPHEAVEYCCMGVLEEIAGTDSVRRNGYTVYEFGDSKDTSFPTQETRVRAGIQTCSHKLAAMNDGTGEFYGGRVDFLGIANWIETHILKPALGRMTKKE